MSVFPLPTCVGVWKLWQSFLCISRRSGLGRPMCEVRAVPKERERERETLLGTVLHIGLKIVRHDNDYCGYQTTHLSLSARSLSLSARSLSCCWQVLRANLHAVCQNTLASRCGPQTERVCCSWERVLFIGTLATSTPQWLRQPKPRGFKVEEK